MVQETNGMRDFSLQYHAMGSALNSLESNLPSDSNLLHPKDAACMYLIEHAGIRSSSRFYPVEEGNDSLRVGGDSGICLGGVLLV